MSWIASQADAKEISPNDLPTPLRIVFSFVANSPYFNQGSIKLFRSDKAERHYVIVGNIFWDLPAKIVDERIQRPEQIAFWYSDYASNSLRPPEIRADRVDFPRDLPHLNVVPDNESVHLCLAREGISSLFSRGGLPALFQRINTWLRDASSGQLDHDGWEPTPRFCPFNAVLDIGWFQKNTRVSKANAPGHSLGHVLLFIEEKAEEKNIHAQLVPRTKALEKIWLKGDDDTSASTGRHTLNSYWFMAWGPRNTPVSERFTRPVNTIADLRAFAAMAGCENKVIVFLDMICAPESKGQAKWFVILIGTWRPKRLIPTIPGLADGEWGKLDLSGFVVLISEKDGARTVSSVYPLRLLSEANPENLNRMAGYSTLQQNTVLVGAGALGSKIGEHLVREGSLKLKIVDFDRFAPHNIARHVLGRDSFHFKKSAELFRLLNGIAKTASISELDMDITTVKFGQFREEITGHESGVLIDCTANMDVQRRLCRSDVVMKNAKLELADNGRIGFLLFEGRGRNPRVDGLKAMIPLLGCDVPEISEWLNRDEEYTVNTGMGCASASMPMSDSRVSLHAANFMATLGGIVRGESHPAGIGIALTDEQGHLTEWNWIEVSPVLNHLLGKDQTQWQVRITQNVISDISAASAKAEIGEDETGGYLYGSYDLSLRTIYVVWSSEPTPVEASATRLHMPPAGSSDKETQILHETGRRLKLLGTWHSHPKGSSRASDQDLLQFAADTVVYASNPSPHVLAIIGIDGLSVMIGYPDHWSN